MGKRGPRKKSGDLKREANGRVARDAKTQAKARDREIANASVEEWEAMETALRARWRVHHVDMSQVRDQMAGSYVGRLCLGGELSRIQYDAAMTYLVERGAYLIAINAPHLPGAVDLNRVQGRVHGENVNRTLQAVAKFEETREAIQTAQNHLGNRGNLHAAIELCVIKDVELSHMVGDLRVVLNALARHYGLTARRAA